MEGELLAGLSLFNTERNYFSYLSKNNGGSVRLGKSLGEYTWGNISYRYELVNINIRNRDVASSFLLSQEGDRTTSSIAPSVTRDTRDDYFNPQKGSRQYLNGEYAGGPLGGVINQIQVSYRIAKIAAGICNLDKPVFIGKLAGD